MTMTFSQAIRKGQDLIEPHPYKFDSCFLGMACVGSGISPKQRTALTQLVAEYPWIARTDIEIPCGCGDPTRLGEAFYRRVGHLFDDHVYGRRDISLAKAIALLEALEPKPTTVPVIAMQAKYATVGA